MALPSQAGNISVKAFPVKDPDLICEAYNLHPNDAAKREAQIAETMHRHIGLRGRLPEPKRDTSPQKTQAERIIDYLREHPGSRMRDIAAALKIPPHRMSNNLGGLKRRGLVGRWYEHDPLGGKFPWARWRLTDDT